ncbi:MAG: ferritin family protein [Spirochaetia bacterium]|nr:ferritin family protein [Spirochaetia bacterium]
MSKYRADEIFQFAIKIEENGKKFYSEMSEKFKNNDKVHELFTDLSKQEVEHKKLFESMLSKFQNYSPEESFPEEYFTYLRSYADSTIFSDEVLKKEKENISDLASALNFAMRRELESINYYNELKNMVPDEDKDKIEQVIQEEKRHFLYLNKIKSDNA